MRSHCIITGTGRAGTSFLVVLFTELGLDTGFTTETIKLDPVAKAGLELDILSTSAPYIVKSPWLCDNIDDVLRVLAIDHAIIPVRNLDDAAASRARVQKDYGLRGKILPVPGGLVHTFSPYKQKDILASQFTHLIQTLVAKDIPMTFLDFPRFTRDPDYLFGKLDFLLGDITYDEFAAAFHKTVKPEWVHDFKSA